jgi:hypothetical protein
MKKVAPTQTLLVSDIKTTHLIFKEAIIYVDVGSPYFVADTVQTLIKLRHIGEDLDNPISLESNLTVITQDGAFYSIPITYNRDSSELTYRMRRSKEYIGKSRREIDTEEKKNLLVQRFADQILFARSNVKLYNKRQDFEISINGIFYDKGFIGIRLVLKNGSAIDLDINEIIFRLKLKTRISPDYIYQERILKPFHIIDKISKIKGFDTKTTVFIFDKFTPNDRELFTIDILEKNGGRSAKIIVPRKILMNPKKL